MADSYAKPLPIVDAVSAPYWEAAKRQEFVMQRCDDCARLRFPPTTSCWSCLSPNTTWAALSGRGTVWSFILMHQLYYPAFADELPYPVAVIETEEGVRLISNLVEVAREDIEIGMAVEVVFEDVTDEFALPKFRPAG